MEAEGLAHRLRVATDALRVMDGVPIAGLDRARESEQDSLGRVKAPVQGALVQEDLRANEELLRVERLAQEVVGARGDPAKAGLAVARRRENHDRNQPAYRMRLETLAHGDAVQPRHVDIEQHEVRLLGGYRVESLVPVPGLPHVVTELDQVSLEKLAVRLDVVDDQHDRNARRNEPRDAHPVTAPPAWSRRWRGADWGVGGWASDVTAARRSAGAMGFDQKWAKPASLVRATSSGRTDALKATIGMSTPRARRFRHTSMPVRFGR